MDEKGVWQIGWVVYNSDYKIMIADGISSCEEKQKRKNISREVVTWRAKSI